MGPLTQFLHIQSSNQCSSVVDFKYFMSESLRNILKPDVPMRSQMYGSYRHKYYVKESRPWPTPNSHEYIWNRQSAAYKHLLETQERSTTDAEKHNIHLQSYIHAHTLNWTAPHWRRAFWQQVRRSPTIHWPELGVELI